MQIGLAHLFEIRNNDSNCSTNMQYTAAFGQERRNAMSWDMFDEMRRVYHVEPRRSKWQTAKKVCLNNTPANGGVVEVDPACILDITRPTCQVEEGFRSRCLIIVKHRSSVCEASQVAKGVTFIRIRVFNFIGLRLLKKRPKLDVALDFTVHDLINPANLRRVFPRSGEWSSLRY